MPRIAWGHTTRYTLNMPELPEVEVTRLGFASQIQGATILGVTLGKPLRWPLGCHAGELVGRRVLAVERRGKYLLLILNRGLLLIHLGMSGSLLFAKALPSEGVHDHFTMVTDLGALRLNDPRRFGAVIHASGMGDPVVSKLLGHLGMEPLSSEFRADEFGRLIRLRKAAIKQVLLSGVPVVGVGNIYACEALFLARIHPATPGNRITVKRANALHSAIVTVLAEAVSQGGSTLRNFSNPEGQAGHFQLHAQVYGREGLACLVCGTEIARIQQGQRSTFFCPKCQRS